MSELIQEYSTHVRSADGIDYIVRAYAEEAGWYVGGLDRVSSCGQQQSGAEYGTRDFTAQPGHHRVLGVRPGTDLL